jgi:putative colanic acid biosynthesis acetyltransferase WcaF
MHHGSSLGDRTHAYCLGPIELGRWACISQEAYLCTGTHKLDDPMLPLQVAKISIGQQTFVGARAFVLPGVTIADGAVIAAAAVVTKDVPEWSIYAGNPARLIGRREMIDA